MSITSVTLDDLVHKGGVDCLQIEAGVEAWLDGAPMEVTRGLYEPPPATWAASNAP